MGYLEQVLQNPVGIIISFFLVLFLIKELYGLYRWYKDREDDLYTNRTNDAEFHKQVNEIASTSEKHTKALEDISQSLIKINERLDDMEKASREADELAEKERKADIVANGRATLYHLYEMLKDKPTLTLSEYETFKDISSRYLEAGGNGAFRNKIIPEIENKQVSD